MIEFQTSQKEWDDVLEALSATNISIAMVVTGGGTGVIPRCFRRVGASLNFVDANVPYSRIATEQYLGFKPVDPFASVSTACALAKAAHARAQIQAETRTHGLGLSMTASLPSHPIVHGNCNNSRSPDVSTSVPRCQIHVASHDTINCRNWSLHFSAGQCKRNTAEAIAEQMFLVAMTASINSPKSQPYEDTLSRLLAAGLAITSNLDRSGSDHNKT
jgi:hypothetical protein